MSLCMVVRVKLGMRPAHDVSMRKELGPGLGSAGSGHGVVRWGRT